MEKKQRLGELLVSNGLVAQEKVDQALKLQVGGNRRLGELLIKMGLLSSDQLIDTLSHQLDMPIVDIDQEFKEDVKGILPRYLCKKYGVLPLALENDRIVKVAMTDPLDDEAVQAVENYTGLVVKPILARQAAISQAISRKTSFSLTDVFNPQTYTFVAKVATGVAVIMLIAAGFLVQRNMYIEKYGTVSVVSGTTIFKNHDLMLQVEPEGKISLMGRGAFADGAYAVSFQNKSSLTAFVENKKKNFSEKQLEWLAWVQHEKLVASK